MTEPQAAVIAEGEGMILNIGGMEKGVAYLRKVNGIRCRVTKLWSQSTGAYIVVILKREGGAT
ncbi:unnamed protein product [marine sediment metagenome]|uniref:Uncharacterized protein n=1 Tax=marine sediment metagenome TaxID=412755 RepID=X0WVZ2_9ZZZZ